MMNQNKAILGVVAMLIVILCVVVSISKPKSSQSSIALVDRQVKRSSTDISMEIYERECRDLRDAINAVTVERDAAAKTNNTEKQLALIDKEISLRNQLLMANRKRTHVRRCETVRNETISMKLSQLTVNQSNEIDECRELGLY